MRPRPLLIPLLLAACSVGRDGYVGDTPRDPAARFDRALSEIWLARLDRDPALRARAGLEPRAGWPAITPRAEELDETLTARELERLEELADAPLGPGRRAARRLVEWATRRRLARLRWRGQAYLAVPGEHPAERVRARLVEDASVDPDGWHDAARGAAAWLDARTEELDERARQGRVAPRRALVQVAAESQAMLAGRPFVEGAAEESPWLTALRARLDASSVDPARRADIVFRAEAALREDVGPAISRWLAHVESLADRAPGDSGAWSLPEGEAWYAFLLEDATTLPLSAGALHALGLAEVARLQEEMRALQLQVDHPGSLASFFELVRDDPRFQATAGEEGEALRATRADDAAATLAGALATWSPSPPREPTLDPAAILTATPSPPAPHEVLALVARRGVPGAGLRRAFAERGTGIRASLEVRAWSEGWDLYALGLPLEAGIVDDPYEAFGLVAEELWAAARIVVDTGLHHERWTPDRAYDWLTSTTPASGARARAAVDHLLVHPGDAAAAPVGALRLREIRDQTAARLGDAFDLAAFHGLVLRGGPRPLAFLEEEARAWRPD